MGEKLPRELREEIERKYCAPNAALASESAGRVVDEAQCDIRTCFQRDVDRITHSKSFRRLIHKTQVFLNPEGDHYRTRLTHTLEVMRIARTISRALGLNEDLTEAIAMGHDLGHTPFGHAGERALREIMGDTGFEHNEQSLRVVDHLEKSGRGLNLTHEARNGIVCHTGAVRPDTLEGRVVRLADRAAYLNHDLDDALRAGILTPSDIPDEITCAFGTTVTERVNTVTRDVIDESSRCGDIALSSSLHFVFEAFYNFMFNNLYLNVRAKSEEAKVLGLLSGLFEHYERYPDKLPGGFREIAERDGLRRAVCDYVSGMTDSYAVAKYEEIFIPTGWQLR